MYNTKVGKKLAFAYRNCPLSLETTKHFQAYINSLLLSGIENFPKCAVYDIVCGLILVFVQRTGLQSVKQDWETFRFYKLYNNLIWGNSANSSIFINPCLYASVEFSRQTEAAMSHLDWSNYSFSTGFLDPAARSNAERHVWLWSLVVDISYISKDIRLFRWLIFPVHLSNPHFVAGFFPVILFRVFSRIV